MDRWLNLGVRGGATWPTEETTVTFGGHPLHLRPATRDTEQSVHINLRDISDVQAMTLVNRFLSVLSWCDDQPMENLGGGSATAIPVAVPRASRAIGSSIAFPFGRDLEREEKARRALALFREGRTARSIAFEVLSYFKILNLIWDDKKDVTGLNPLVEGIRAILPKITDGAATERLQELAARGRDIPAYLYKSGRCAIAHAHRRPIVDPDEATDLHRLSQDVWIVKAIAEHLIEETLKVSRSIVG